MTGSMATAYGVTASGYETYQSASAFQNGNYGTAAIDLLSAAPGYGAATSDIARALAERGASAAGASLRRSNTWWSQLDGDTQISEELTQAGLLGPRIGGILCG